MARRLAKDGGTAKSPPPSIPASTPSLGRQQLVDEDFDAMIVRKNSPASARPRFFDGAAEEKLIALACSKPPKGRKRWTLQLLEEPVEELKIVNRANDKHDRTDAKMPSPAA
jgi:hypothetical protein